MRSLAEIESWLDKTAAGADAPALLAAAEQVLEHWVIARGGAPTAQTREGFRLLALHRQGARGDPAFNACRETCREIVYHFNLIGAEPDSAATGHRLRMMTLLVRHLALFVTGRLQTARLGEFCCSSRPLRLESADSSQDA